MGLESRVRVPLSTKTGYVGAIALNHREQSQFSREDQELLRRIAAQAAPALEKSLLLERTRSEANTQEALAKIGRVFLRI